MTLVFPELVIATDCVPLFPMTTLPKLALVGFALSWITCATPVALSKTTVGLLDALLTKETWPDALPAAVGANCTL